MVPALALRSPASPRASLVIVFTRASTPDPTPEVPGNLSTRAAVPRVMRFRTALLLLVVLVLAGAPAPDSSAKRLKSFTFCGPEACWSTPATWSTATCSTPAMRRGDRRFPSVTTASSFSTHQQVGPLSCSCRRTGSFGATADGGRYLVAQPKRFAASLICSGRSARGSSDRSSRAVETVEG